ncbi:STAS domain-containing protein [Peribacillus frigoritolerans]|nr:STAS domain-containing protein [Peribacillus frigoritolerans]
MTRRGACPCLKTPYKSALKKNVTRLFIDLSGVHAIDSGSAHQLSQLIESLHLIGIQTTLSGLRPENSHDCR